MKVNVFSAVVFGALAVAASSVAMAQGTPAPGAVPAAPVDPAATPPPTATASGGPAASASASKMRLGVTLMPMPLGSLETNALGTATSVDSAIAFGIMPVFDYLVLPNVFVGAAPSYTFNVKGKDQTGDSSSQLDLLLRVGYGLPINEKLGLYGYGSPGYSIISPPQGDSAKGLVVGLHAGAMYDVASNLFLNGQVGYQLGFQKLSDTDFKSSFLQLGLGVGMRL
jgi:Outer membrane protein beta-barrel domain